jgi:hypothetical protein
MLIGATTGHLTRGLYSFEPKAADFARTSAVGGNDLDFPRPVSLLFLKK